MIGIFENLNVPICKNYKLRYKYDTKEKYIAEISLYSS